MNRRELLQLGAGSLAGLPLAVTALPLDAWQLRVRLVRHELSPGEAVPALVTEVLVRGAVRSNVPVRVQNDADRAVALRSGPWDRDLALASGMSGQCRLQLGAGSAVFCAAEGSTPVRGLLHPAPATPGTVDAQYDLPLHGWSPAEHRGACRATLGDKLLSASEPLRVRAGQRIRLRFFHASGERAMSLHLPGHDFDVQAIDDVPLRRPVRVAHLRLAPGERIDVHVTMNNPGRWLLGSLSRIDRQAGFGRVIEYAGAHGAPVAAPPAALRFNPAQFALPAEEPREEDARAQEVILDDTAWSRRVLAVEPGRLQRLVLSNLSGALQVVAVRGHAVELVQTGSTHVRELYKDVLALPPFSRVAAQFVPRAMSTELLRLSSGIAQA